MVDTERQRLINELFDWSVNALKQKSTCSRLAALSIFAFIVEIEDDSAKLHQLLTDLDKLLPIDSIEILNGVSTLFKRLATKVSDMNFHKIYERCVSWLSIRSTKSAILSAVKILHKFALFGGDDFFNDTKDIASATIWTAIKFDSPQIQNEAIDLYFMYLSHLSETDHNFHSVVALFISSIQYSPPVPQILGSLGVLKRLLFMNSSLCSQRFLDIYPALMSVLKESKLPYGAFILHLFIKTCAENADSHKNEILDLFSNGWKYYEPEVYNALIGFSQIFPNEFVPLCFRIAHSMRPEYMNAYFALISVSFKENPDVFEYLDTFREAELSEDYIIAFYEFAKVFPAEDFKVLNIMNLKLSDALTNNLKMALILIQRFETFRIADFSQYWSKLFDYLPKLPEELKVILIRTLLSIIRNDKKNREKHFTDLLFAIQSESSHKVIRTLINNIDSSMYELVSYDINAIILSSFFEIKSKTVSVSLLNLWNRMKKKYPITIFNTFFSRYKIYITLYYQYPTINERRKLMYLFPLFIESSDFVAKAFLPEYYQFLIDVLDEPIKYADSFAAKLGRHSYIKQTIRIHINALQSLLELNNFGHLYKPQKLVHTIINQLFLFNDMNVHVAALIALRSFFRHFSYKNIDIIKLHQDLFAFMKKSRSTTVYKYFLKLLGTIGPIDTTFNMCTGQDLYSFNRLSLLDVSKREQGFLDFILKYLVAQLKSPLKLHDPSILLGSIHYIFQFDGLKSISFLPVLIELFSDLQSVVQPDSIFHILKSIIVAIDTNVQPYEESILKLIRPHYTTSINALQCLSALVFALKTYIKPFIKSICKDVFDLLEEGQPVESEIYLFQTFTHLIIFGDAPIVLYMKQISKRLQDESHVALFALKFLTMAVQNRLAHEYHFYVAQVAMRYVDKQEPYRSTALNMLSSLYQKNPEMIKRIIDPSILPEPTLLPLSPDPTPLSTPPPFKPNSISTVFEKQKIAKDKNWNLWFLQLSQSLVLCSASPAIRACHPLLNASSQLNRSLFPLVLLSVWEGCSEEDQQKIVSYLYEIVNSEGIPLDILEVITDSIDVMNRSGYSLFDPVVCGDVAEKCDHLFRAIRFYQLVEDQNNTIKSKQLHLMSRMKRKESAYGLYKITDSANESPLILEAISLWSNAREIYQEQNTDEGFIGYIRTSAHIEDYNAISLRKDQFMQLNSSTKHKVALYFAIAAHVGNDDITPFLEYIDGNDCFSCIWRAIFAIKKNDFRTAHRYINNGINLNSSDLTPFLSGNYEPAIKTILDATFFEELNDIIDVQNKAYSAAEISELWRMKSESCNSVDSLFTMYRIRQLLESGQQIQFKYADVLRKLKEWEIFDNVFQGLVESDEVRLLRAKVRFDRKQATSLDEIQEVILTTKDINVKCNAICSLSTRSTTTPETLGQLKEVLDIKPNMLRALKHWANGNLYLAQNNVAPVEVYAKNAMQGFNQLIIKSGPALHYLSQLCSLCFTYSTCAEDFNVLESLPPASIQPVIEQLIMQLDHPNDFVRESMSRILLKLAETHIQAIAFPLAFLSKMENLTKPVKDFIHNVKEKSPALSEEVLAVTDGLTKVAFFSAEMISHLIDSAIEKLDSNYDEQFLIALLHKMVSIYKLKHIGHDKEFLIENKQISVKFEYLSKIQINNIKLDWATIRKYLVYITGRIHKEIEALPSFEIIDAAPYLIDKSPFSLAVPGFYTIGKEYATIDSFVKIVKMIPSAKCPRKIRVRSSKGKIYKYLLKGREDLRLDQRVMQWFSLTNSLLKDDKSGIEKNLFITQYSIIPLSPLAGMISWAEGGDTLYSLITRYNNYRRPESKVLENEVIIDFNQNGRASMVYLTSLGKLELFHGLCSVTPDTALRESIWLLSPSADVWFSQVTNFARSNALMSMAGYIIGLGDRHPSNILYMKETGNVVHIDYSDCLDKAVNRPYCPEKVPFRLTRMMVKALGASGVEGVFQLTALYVMHLMRRNKSTLLGFLDIFTQDFDPSYPKKKQIEERISDKLNGREFEEEKTVEEQVDSLIQAAQDQWNLSQMFIGWAPHW